MKICRLCRKPAVTVPALASVKEALELMTKEKVGAVVVLENEEAAGMFTRRDAIERVVLKKLSLESTRISSVMTSPVEVLCLLFIHPPAPWVGSQPCGAKYPGFCADSKGV